MRRNSTGMTLIELIIGLAIIGILAGVGITQFNYAGVATRQAGQAVASAVNRARIEAIRGNRIAGFQSVAASAAYPSGYVRVCVDIDETAALACPTPADPTNVAADASTVQFLNLSDGDLARARINDSVEIFFDRRGVVRGPQQFTVGISDRNGGNARTVVIEATGRASVQ